jgi:hypothetical protein
MPFKDPAQRRAYKRAWAARRKALPARSAHSEASGRLSTEGDAGLRQRALQVHRQALRVRDLAGALEVLRACTALLNCGDQAWQTRGAGWWCGGCAYQPPW